MVTRSKQHPFPKYRSRPTRCAVNKGRFAVPYWPNANPTSPNFHDYKCHVVVLRRLSAPFLDAGHDAVAQLACR